MLCIDPEADVDRHCFDAADSGRLHGAPIHEHASDGHADDDGDDDNADDGDQDDENDEVDEECQDSEDHGDYRNHKEYCAAYTIYEDETDDAVF